MPEPARQRGARPRSLDRSLAWLVTGPLGRGGAFFIDFCRALGHGLRSVAASSRRAPRR